MAAAPTEVDHEFRPGKSGPLTSTTVMGGGLTSRSRVLLSIHRLALRAARPPFDRVWARLYLLLARALAAYLTWRQPAASAYTRGSVAAGDFVPGLSDLDTVLIVSDGSGSSEARERALGRWQRLTRTVPPIGLLLDGPMIYRDTDLRELSGVSALTYGLESPTGAPGARAGYFGEHANFDWLRKLERPGLYGPTADWRLLRGPDRRPPAPQANRQSQRIAAWLELLYLWRWAFPACIDPTGPRTAALCVTLVVEPARIWLWLARGERPHGQGDVLQGALRSLPEEEEALRRTIELRRSLSRSPDPPLSETLPTLVRMSTRIAGLISSELADQGVTEVRLAAGDPADLILADGAGSPDGADGSAPLPLVDWRALACPMLPDENFAEVPGDPGDPAILAAVAHSRRDGPYPALRHGNVMVLPAGPWWRTRLRAVKSTVTDPVVFALADGGEIASFPRVSGWSAEDTARRAVAEHRAWLHGERGPWAVRESGQGGGALAMLMTAARAALFLQSLREHDPELPLTVAEAARRLAVLSTADATVAEEALGHYREFALQGVDPPGETVAAMRGLVLDLPAYAGDGGQA